VAWDGRRSECADSTKEVCSNKSGDMRETRGDRRYRERRAACCNAGIAVQLRDRSYHKEFCPSVTQGGPRTRCATRAARVVAGHAQNALEDSVESGPAMAGCHGYHTVRLCAAGTDNRQKHQKLGSAGENCGKFEPVAPRKCRSGFAWVL
jgi:hypothetical protein